MRADVGRFVVSQFSLRLRWTFRDRLPDRFMRHPAHSGQLLRGESELCVGSHQELPPSPRDAPLLPTVIDENDVHIELPAGVYDQTLTVNGNGFQLTGEACGNCAEDGWTTITGAVVVQGNNASFTNIKFLGPVTVLGNNVSFSHVCFENKLLILGERPDVPDEEEPEVSCDEAVDFEPESRR